MIPFEAPAPDALDLDGAAALAVARDPLSREDLDLLRAALAYGAESHRLSSGQGFREGSERCAAMREALASIQRSAACTLSPDGAAALGMLLLGHHETHPAARDCRLWLEALVRAGETAASVANG